jgi:NADH-quinone oxidoreductase subunit E
MDLARVDSIINEYGADPSWLVMILQDVQGIYNYLPELALRHVASRLGVALAQVYNVATFYSSFCLEERGKHVVRICDGTACHLRGAMQLGEQVARRLGIHEGETTPDRLFSLELVACLGACALAPVIQVDSEYHGQMTVQKLEETLQSHRASHSGPSARTARHAAIRSDLT